MSEVQNLQANQKQEIEELYLRKGKVPPSGLVSPATMLNQRQRRFSKTGNYPPARKSSLQRGDMLHPAGWEDAVQCSDISRTSTAAV